MKFHHIALSALSGLIVAPWALAVDVNTLYTQTGTDPTWQQLLDRNAIPVGVTSTAGVTGSTINVVNSLVDVGQNANNPNLSGLRIHTLGNSSVSSGAFSKWSRWYQQDGKTQVFRLFQGEYNVRNDRANAARIEAFAPNVAWQFGDGWHKWQATYTIIKPIGAAIFQAKNDVNDWSVQINMSSSGNVTLNRRVGADIVMAQNMVGEAFDIAIYDNGLNYQVFLNDVFQGAGQFSRPTGVTKFRWGMYVGNSVPQTDGMLFVTGAKITANATLPQPPIEPGDLLVGWSNWASGYENATVANFGASGGTTETGDWRESNAAASNDGTYGSLVTGASTWTGSAETGTYIGITGDGSHSFTITAGANALSLSSFHFDAMRKRSNSPENWLVEVIAGNITLGTLASGTLHEILGAPGPTDHNDFDIDLATLSDNELMPGESATIRISFTGGDPTNTDQQTYLDNVAITGHAIIIANSAPTELTAVAASSSQIDLTWTDNSTNEEVFEIWRVSGEVWEYVAQAGADVTFYSDTGLAPGTAYSYYIWAFNAAGYSDSSNEASATTPLDGDE